MNAMDLAKSFVITTAAGIFALVVVQAQQPETAAQWLALDVSNPVLARAEFNDAVTVERAAAVKHYVAVGNQSRANLAATFEANINQFRLLAADLKIDNRKVSFKEVIHSYVVDSTAEIR